VLNFVLIVRLYLTCAVIEKGTTKHIEEFVVPEKT
jgi:hypothetical protein